MFMIPHTSYGTTSEHTNQEDWDSENGTNPIGWFARLSAAGYLDCTDWIGPFDTELEAIKALWEEHGDSVETVEDVCEYFPQFADFWLAYTQAIAFTASADSEGGSLFGNEQRTIAMVRTIGGTAKRQYGYFARKRDAEYYLRRFLQIVACQRGRISGHVVCSTAEIVKV